MRVCYDPPIGGNYEARSGSQASGQEIRVSMLVAAIGLVSRAKDLYNTGPHSLTASVEMRLLAEADQNYCLTLSVWLAPTLMPC
jgi:hypothetical protein